MWVLDARKDAEVIWYNIVWEDEQLPPNVIDYNIRAEQTIDANSTMIANNQTTTGMATVIPWLNTPKLISNTSVVTINL